MTTSQPHPHHPPDLHQPPASAQTPDIPGTADERDAATPVCCAPAEDLPFEDATFDVVVSTLVLCGVDDQPRARRELRRVLRPGGQFLFIEHVRSGDNHLTRSQDCMTGINRFVVGCDCNRPTLDSIREAGLTVTVWST
jgi:SAM-dependent methyltransferase